METMAIRCGHCSSLIALTAESPDQAVRCPYCQQLVLAGHDSSFVQPVAAQQGEGERGRGGESAASDAAAISPLLSFSPAPLPPQAPRVGQRSHGWLVSMVLVPLFVYAVLATIAVVLLWNRVQQMPPHPLEMFPDVEGDTPGVQKQGQKTAPVRGALAPETVWKLADMPLPGQLRCRLGQTLRVGDLEVTPRGVERQVVRVFVEGSARPEPCRQESLVLQLHLHNGSAETTFTPLDNFFDRRWKKGAGPPPLTVLEMGAQRFHGGPAEWGPRGGAANVRRQWLEGRQDCDERGLGPGEALDTFVCTDGDNPRVLQELERFQGTLLWRIQLRRGLVQVGRRHLPTAAVVGVEFTPREIVPARERGSSRPRAHTPHRET